MTAQLRPTTLPTIEDVAALAPDIARRLAQDLKANKGAHTGDFWECRACSIIATVDGRRA